jgi:probable rRNA maturation factor
MRKEPDQPPPAAPVVDRGKSRELVVRNLQRRLPIDSRGLTSFLGKVASEVGASESSATLALVNDERIRRLNHEFRGYDKPTDVLSFAAGDAPDAGYLGDIVISVDTASRQAQRRGTKLVRELELLTLHGFLHLMGYDHETDDGRMRRLEYRLRKKFGISRPRRPKEPPGKDSRIGRGRR